MEIMDRIGMLKSRRQENISPTLTTVHESSENINLRNVARNNSCLAMEKRFCKYCISKWYWKRTICQVVARSVFS